eukprot:293391-Pleurochrysis_carterae.AAC.1
MPRAAASIAAAAAVAAIDASSTAFFGLLAPFGLLTAAFAAARAESWPLDLVEPINRSRERDLDREKTPDATSADAATSTAAVSNAAAVAAAVASSRLVAPTDADDDGDVGLSGVLMLMCAPVGALIRRAPPALGVKSAASAGMLLQEHTDDVSS